MADPSINTLFTVRAGDWCRTVLNFPNETCDGDATYEEFDVQVTTVEHRWIE